MLDGRLEWVVARRVAHTSEFKIRSEAVVAYVLIDQDDDSPLRDPCVIKGS